MILYNMRERGAFEYDKFTLNVLQIHNAINLNELHELDSLSDRTDSLKEISKEVNKIYNHFVGENDTIGICEKIYKQGFKFKGGL